DDFTEIFIILMRTQKRLANVYFFNAFGQPLQGFGRFKDVVVFKTMNNVERLNANGLKTLICQLRERSCRRKYFLATGLPFFADKGRSEGPSDFLIRKGRCKLLRHLFVGGESFGNSGAKSG